MEIKATMQVILFVLGGGFHICLYFGDLMGDYIRNRPPDNGRKAATAFGTWICYCMILYAAGALSEWIPEID